MKFAPGGTRCLSSRFFFVARTTPLMEDPPYQDTHPCVACTTAERVKKFSAFLGRFRFGSQEFQFAPIPPLKNVLAFRSVEELQNGFPQLQVPIPTSTLAKFDSAYLGTCSRHIPQRASRQCPPRLLCIRFQWFQINAKIDEQVTSFAKKNLFYGVS